MSFLCFQSPDPGKVRPLRTPPYPSSLPPWRDANTQQGKQGRATETAVKRYHIGSTGTSGADPNRHNCDGSGGSTSFPRPSPRKSVRLHFPERLARGRWRLGRDGGVAAPGGERSPPSGLAWDRLRPRGPGLWGGAVRQLARLCPPG